MPEGVLAGGGSPDSHGVTCSVADSPTSKLVAIIIDGAGRRHIELDPAEADFSRLRQADGLRAERLRAMRSEMASPIHFLRGNHEDFQYLSGLLRKEADRTARVDDFNLFRYVLDGTVPRTRDLRIAFLGGVETELKGG